MEQKTVSFQDLDNVVNQLAHTLDEPLRSKTANILNFKLWQV